MVVFRRPVKITESFCIRKNVNQCAVTFGFWAGNPLWNPGYPHNPGVTRDTQRTVKSSVLLYTQKYSSDRTWHYTVAWDNPAIIVASLCCLRFHYLILNFGRFSFRADGVNSKQSERRVLFLFCFKLTCLRNVFVPLGLIRLSGSSYSH